MNKIACISVSDTHIIDLIKIEITAVRYSVAVRNSVSVRCSVAVRYIVTMMYIVAVKYSVAVRYSVTMSYSFAVRYSVVVRYNFAVRYSVAVKYNVAVRYSVAAGKMSEIVEIHFCYINNEHLFIQCINKFISAYAYILPSYNFFTICNSCFFEQI